MTDTAVSAAHAPGALPVHPLAPVTGAEFLAGRQVLAAAGLLAEPVRFAYYGLEEPPKGEVLAAGAAPERRLRAFLIDISTGESSDVVLSLATGQVVSRRVLDPRADGQLPIIDADFAAAEEIVRADPGWRAAMARRGLTDVTKIRACPLTAGWFGVAEEAGRRMVRVLAFVQAREHDLAWAHPVDGLSAYVDLVSKRVFRLVDEFEADVP
ncbi:MAG TPA: histamine oxidase, partial [Streptosporangiaceae bacterium]|nr:histamine oxidase [Streptosporangiaceae bacterium]